jgi:ABC-2 type transport system permease protein
MFATIFNFEIKRWLKTPATYIYFLVLFIIGFLAATIAAGTFDGVVINFGGEKVNANAPANVDILLGGINYLIGVVIITAVIGNAILVDFRFNTYTILFPTPVSKFDYLGGRFFGALVICLLILTGAAFGMMLAYIMPWVDAARIGPFVPAAYLTNFLYTVIPNTLFAGALFFAVSLISRDIFMIWICLIVLFVAIGISSTLLTSLDKQWIAAYLSPFGTQAKFMLTKYWSVFDKNNRLIPLEGVFLYNRLIWMGVGVVMWVIGYSYFSFSSAPRSLFGSKKVVAPTILPNKISFQKVVFPKAKLEFGTAVYLRHLWGLSINESKALMRNVYFRIIILFGLVLLFVVSAQIGKLYDTATYPVTSEVIQFLGGTFHLFIVILTIIFSGELIWRARELRMSNILDALPVPNWVFYSSKLIALMFMQVVLLAVVILAGVIVQLFKGYTNLELFLYIKYLYGFLLIDYWLLAVLAMMVHVLVNNKYLGYFIIAIFYIWNTFAMPVVKHNLFIYSSDPGIVYSEMNKFGHGIFPFFVYKLYWSGLAIAFAALSSLMWPRGSDDRIKQRWTEAKLKGSRPAWVAMSAGVLLFLLGGAYIYYNTNVIHTFRTDFQSEAASAKYEKNYRKYFNIPQPKITAVKLNVDIYPEERNLHSSGFYTLKNKTAVPIPDIHLNLPDEVDYKKLSFSRPATLKLNDKEANYRIYSLSAPLQPGDSVLLEFDLVKNAKGFTTRFAGLSAPNYNGTFMNNSNFLPYIGYNPDGELSDNSRRKKHGLAYRPTALPITSAEGRQRNMFERDADFIDFDATVSTSADQLAIAPGYLQKEWKQGDRRYFHYKMDSPIINFYSFLSGRYEVKKQNWNGVALEIWYQKGHEYNLERMFNGMKKSLAYYTAHFSPYQHKQVRIVEFPRYATFAQSFPNTIPFSEGIGFIADVESDDNNVDYPFYVTAHEVAHQWFAHQVIGGDVEGSNMLSETLAQYGAIMTLEKEYGEKKIRKFLSYEMDRYLNNRSNESEKEKPLALADIGQGYILYQKGGIVMYGLSKYIGEDSLNHAIKRFLQQYAFKAPPYPTTMEFVQSIRQSTPDSMQYFVSDVFDRIVFYENKISNSKLTSKDTSNYDITLTVNSSKKYADSLGKETAAPMNDYVEVGVYDRKGNQLYLERYKFRQGDNKLSIHVTRKPHKVVVDPRHLLFDKRDEDNEKVLKI